MIYFLLAVLLVILFYVLLIFIRKTMWDAVHRNLLDLEDRFEGRVMRRGFATRPVFHGKMNGISFTINFSTEKKEGRRNTYIDFSFALASEISCTVSEKEWLQKQTSEEIRDYLVMQNKSGKEFILRPASAAGIKKIAQSPALKNIIDSKGLAYLFAGKSGLICEFATEEVVKFTEVDNLEKIMQLIQSMSGVFKR